MKTKERRRQWAAEFDVAARKYVLKQPLQLHITEAGITHLAKRDGLCVPTKLVTSLVQCQGDAGGGARLAR